ncbi:MAG: COX15/CtaA family protein [Pseudomonadales bacterium]|nr:COX15/CtaA family protein [Pseudomonadales bacterium]
MTSQNKTIAMWLTTVCATIFAMVVVGGITRLTESGLSMVDWRPVMGVIPPISDAEWAQAFNDYKQFPEYQKINAGMALAEFKSIFYWEFGHRVLGRFIGLVYFVPFLYFLVRKQIPTGYQLKLWIGLLLGGSQGLMGWYMVKSGLIDMPRVSHYRLAAHLGLALIIIAYLFWLVLSLVNVSRQGSSQAFLRGTYLLVGLVILQIVYGAFVAGSHSGYGFNTFPLMNGDFIPDLAFAILPFWHNLLENNAMLQFVHRWVGAAVLLVALILTIKAKQSGSKAIFNAMLMCFCGIVVQFLLGVFTLVYVVPIELASIHQAGACIVVLLLVNLTFRAQLDPQQT